MICAFSGHRPQRLPWGEMESDRRCEALKLRIAREVGRLYREGCTVFLCGMARGGDTYFAEAVLELQKDSPQTELWAVLPCRSQADHWPEPDRRRYESLCRASRQVILLQEHYTSGCMLRRNRWMLEHADCLLTVYDGGAGGTGWMVTEARRQQIPVISLWL